MADEQDLSVPQDALHVVLLEGVHQSAVEYLASRGYTHVTHLTRAPSGAELKEILADAHMVGIRSRTQLTAEVVEAAPKLMAVGCFCIGTNQVDLHAAARLGTPVFNAPHSNTRSVAEMMIAEMVMLLRGLGDKNTATHQGVWTKSAKDSYELRGKTLGIVGYGHIGSQVSILAEALGMKVLYYDVEPKLPMGNAEQVSSLEALLGRAEIVTLHVPEDESTRNLISAQRIAHMRSGAYLLNASRAVVVDVDAVAEAINSGHLNGAAIDVHPGEPRSKDERFSSPLQGQANVILTPHIGGSTLEAQRNIGTEVAAKLVNYSNQGTTIGAVNFPQLSLAPHTGAHRLLHIHHNQAGVLGEINNAIAASNANILGQSLQTTPELGYVVIDVDQEYSHPLFAKLRDVPGTIRARILY